MKKVALFGLFVFILFGFLQAQSSTGYQIPVAISISPYSYNASGYGVQFRWCLHYGEGMYPIHYQLERNGVIIAESEANVLYLLDTGLNAGVSYTYRLFAQYDDGSVFAAEEEVIVLIDPQTGEMLHAVPNLFVANVNKNQVILLWGLSGEGSKPIHYLLERNEEIIAELEGNVFSYYDADLELGRYTYRLTAQYENTDFLSEEKELVITVDQMGEESPYTVPTHFSHEVDNGNNVILFWRIFETETAMSPQHYEIERDNAVIAIVENNVFAYYDADLEQGQSHIYRLWAQYEDGHRLAVENELEVYTYDINAPISVEEGVEVRRLIVDDGVSWGQYFPPVNFTSEVEGNNVILRWEIPERGIQPDIYQLERNGEIIMEINGSLRTYTDPGLEEGTYSYAISAIYSNIDMVFRGGIAVCTIRDCD